ncbi:hypothetical protein F5B21DRAFT_452359 [Xylaria acuta]|nr:hypothetical protein F5B21DRAFT_452359 [Xylaria acuta]
MFRVDDEAGQFVGMISSNGSGDTEVENRKSCEFIVLSGGTISKSRSDNKDDNKDVSMYNSIEEWPQVEEIKDLETYGFLNVLWVERDREIVYRKALGRMWKVAWERQYTEEVDMVLG